MKLCFLAGANSIHSKRWIKYFADRGYKVYLISLKPESSNDFGKVKLYLIKKIRYTPILASHLLNLLPVLIQMKILIKKIKPDILHAHCVGGYGWLGALSGFHPLIITAWGDDVLIDPKKSKINKILTKFALKKADLITCNGKPLEKEMMRLGVDPKKIKFIYWATDIYQFKPGIKNKKLRRKLEIFDSPMIISLRSFETIYDVETLIRCVPLVLKEIPRAKFVVAGKGSQELRLKKLAKSLGVFSNIKFVGWIPHEKLPEYLNLADIYVSTALSDGDLSQSTQQAMACELPIITTDIIVNRNRIKDGKNGFLILIKDPKSLAQKIIILLRDAKLRKKLGKEGRKTIEEKLNYYKEMEKAEDLYKELINSYKK